MDFGSVERLGNMQMPGDEPVEERQHDKVEHDGHYHLVSTELRLEVSGNGSDNSAAGAGGDHAERQRENERRPNRKSEPGESGAESAGRELTLASDVEQSGAEAE